MLARIKRACVLSMRREGRGERKKRDMDQRGEMLKNTEIWKRKGAQWRIWEAGVWRRERWNRKWGREREGWSNAFWQRWVQDGFMVTSWLILYFSFFEESIDRRTVHLSLDTHVGDQAERSCAGTHAGSCVDKLWMHPKLCAKSADTHTLLPPPPYFFCSSKTVFLAPSCLCSKLFVHLFVLEEFILVYALRSLAHTFLLCSWVTHFPVSSIPLCMFLLQGCWTLNERTLPGGMNELLHFTGCVYKTLTKKEQACVHLCVHKCVCANELLCAVAPASLARLSAAPNFSWHQSECGEIVISS